MAQELPDLEPHLVRWVEEAATLRKRLTGVYSNDDGPRRVHDALLKARATLDRTEEIVVMLRRLKGRTYVALVTARHNLRDAEDKAYQSRSVGFEQYVTSREREAWVSTQTMTERVEMMRVQKLDLEVGNALEVVETIHKGIDSVRRDADTRLRFMTFERQLER